MSGATGGPSDRRRACRALAREPLHDVPPSVSYVVEVEVDGVRTRLRYADVREAEKAAAWCRAHGYRHRRLTPAEASSPMSPEEIRLSAALTARIHGGSERAE